VVFICIYQIYLGTNGKSFKGREMNHIIIGTIGMLAVSAFIIFFLNEIKTMIKDVK